MIVTYLTLRPLILLDPRGWILLVLLLVASFSICVLLHRPLQPSSKILVVCLSGASCVAFTLFILIMGPLNLWFFPATTALTAFTAIAEHSWMGKVLLPFLRTNAEVIVV